MFLYLNTQYTHVYTALVNLIFHCKPTIQGHAFASSQLWNFIVLVGKLSFYDFSLDPSWPFHL